MWISELKLENIRSFVGEQSIELSKNVNVIVGHNNFGKSTILQSLLLLQDNRALLFEDKTLGKNEAKIEIKFEEPSSYIFINKDFFPDVYPRVLFSVNEDEPSNNFSAILYNEKIVRNFNRISDIEPNNFIYPYSSKRKVYMPDGRHTEESSKKASGDLKNLYAKVDALCSSSTSEAEEFKKAFKDILGFQISTVYIAEQKKAAYQPSINSHITLDKMGEGVPNIAGLLVELCKADKKLFLIEEPENDIHPKALKDLLRLIEKKSENNQFIISTHSNIVTKYLGSIKDSKVFKVSMSINEITRLPNSEVKEVENEPVARLQLLEELGYEPFDFAQWKAWLILEESSAEVVVRDFLIPNFVPKLEYKLRTYSANSRDEVELKFRDFNNLFVFIHLEKRYKDRAWVVIDASGDEEKIIKGMRETYKKSGWNEENFLQFSEHDFEKYYPKTFQPKVEAVLNMGSNSKKERTEKREAKKELIKELKQWWKANPEQAKTEFTESAKEIIDILINIEKRIV